MLGIKFLALFTLVAMLAASADASSGRAMLQCKRLPICSAQQNLHGLCHKLADLACLSPAHPAEGCAVSDPSSVSPLLLSCHSNICCSSTVAAMLGHCCLRHP